MKKRIVIGIKLSRWNKTENGEAKRGDVVEGGVRNAWERKDEADLRERTKI